MSGNTQIIVIDDASAAPRPAKRGDVQPGIQRYFAAVDKETLRAEAALRAEVTEAKKRFEAQIAEIQRRKDAEVLEKSANDGKAAVRITEEASGVLGCICYMSTIYNIFFIC